MLGRFDYLDEPPSTWAERLSFLNDRNVKTIHSRVLWGAHETTRGIRDFSKSSRLRVEKFLSIVQDLGLKVHFEFGFPHHHEALPTWTQAADETASVPRNLFEEFRGGAEFVTVPSLGSNEVLPHFRSFIGDFLAVIQHYRDPEGPVSGVSFDPGFFRFSQDEILGDAYIHLISRRYDGSIDKLNKVYGTSFTSFQLVGSKQGTRTLFDRRPWLAAFDYKFIRRQVLDSIKELVHLQFAEAGFPVIENAMARADISSESSSSAILIESTLFENTSECGLSILAPCGVVNQAVVGMTKLGEYFLEHAVNGDMKVFFTENDAKIEFASELNLIFVICGRYFSRDPFHRLLEKVHSGAQLVFPAFLPHYDEYMERLSPPGVGVGTKRFMVGSKVFRRSEFGEGAIWFVDEPYDFQKIEPWNLLNQIRDELQVFRRGCA